jgi:protein involved in polysaccharide export with SLBB domain
MRLQLAPIILLLLCLSASVLGQSPFQLYSIKLGKLEPGDRLMITVIKEPYLVTGTDRVRFSLNVTIRDDNRMGVPPLLIPILTDVLAGGLTTSELRQALEMRYAETNYDTSIMVQFLGPRYR